MRGTEVSEFIDSAYTWQERATKAEAEAADWQEVAKQHMKKVCKLEAEVERLQKVYYITNESWKRLKEENILLRKVAEAAREFISSTGCNPKKCGKCNPKYIDFCKWSGIGQTLAELDKEGER